MILVGHFQLGNSVIPCFCDLSCSPWMKSQWRQSLVLLPPLLSVGHSSDHLPSVPTSDTELSPEWLQKQNVLQPRTCTDGFEVLQAFF